MKPSSENANHLPEPEQGEKASSAELCVLIENACVDAGGMIPFSDFMQLALYAPGLGYYAGGRQKFGAAGDFITAPEVSPLFSRCLAKQVTDVLAGMEQACILEYGAGSGIMAADMLLALESEGMLPERYLVIELSAELRRRQAETVGSKAPHLLDRVQWLDALPDEKLNVVVLANEVLDAMPVECFRIAGDNIESLWVHCKQGHLLTEYLPANGDIGAAVRKIEERRGSVLADGYCSEFNPAIAGWLKAISEIMCKGAVFLVDYGYTAREYYHEERSGGTLMCHYRHRAHADPLWYPGLQDITAFVDFTDVAYGAVAAGFDVSGYTSQAMFLMSSGLDDLYESMASEDPKQQIMLAQQIKTLTLPSEMGERFKVMALTKDHDEPLRGFAMQDLRNRL